MRLSKIMNKEEYMAMVIEMQADLIEHLKARIEEFEGPSTCGFTLSSGIAEAASASELEEILCPKEPITEPVTAGGAALARWPLSFASICGVNDSASFGHEKAYDPADYDHSGRPYATKAEDIRPVINWGEGDWDSDNPAYRFLYPGADETVKYKKVKLPDYGLSIKTVVDDAVKIQKPQHMAPNTVYPPGWIYSACECGSKDCSGAVVGSAKSIHAHNRASKTMGTIMLPVPRSDWPKDFC